MTNGKQVLGKKKSQTIGQMSRELLPEIFKALSIQTDI